MNVTLLILGIIVLGYWWFGRSQPEQNRSMILHGVPAILILGVGILLVLLALL